MIFQETISPNYYIPKKAYFLFLITLSQEQKITKKREEIKVFKERCIHLKVENHDIPSKHVETSPSKAAICGAAAMSRLLYCSSVQRVCSLPVMLRMQLSKAMKYLNRHHNMGYWLSRLTRIIKTHNPNLI